MHTPSPRRKRPKVGTLAAGLLGLLLTALVSLWLWSEERASWQSSFDATTDETVAILRLTLDSTLHAAHGVGAFLREVPDADQSAFERVVAAAVAEHPEIAFVAFHARVPQHAREALVERMRSSGVEDFAIRELIDAQRMVAAPERHEYFPAVLLSPASGPHRLAWGFSPAGGAISSGWWRQVQQAGRAGTTVVTARGNLLSTGMAAPGVAVMHPVGDGDELRGFVALGLHAADIGAALFARSPIARARLRAHVFDVTDNGKPTVLYSDSLPVGDADALLASDLRPQALRSGPHAEYPIEIGGRRWLVVFEPTEAFTAQFSPMRPLLIGAAGLAFTLLLMLYLRSLSMRTASVEQQVDERTRAWRMTNQELVASLEQQKQTQQRLEEALRERENALTAQRESEILFHTAFEHATGPAALILPNGRFLETNAAFSRLVGFSRTDLSLMTMHELTHPADRYVTPTEIDKVLRGEQSGFRIEKRYIHKDGRIVWIEAQSAVVRDARGHPRFFVGHMLDVTQSRHDQRQLERLSRQQDWILNTSREAILGLDERGCASFVNEAACELLGYSREALLGGALHQLVHHSHANGQPYPEHECPIARALAVPSRGPHEVRGDTFWRRDGSRIVVDYTVTPMVEGKQVTGAVLVITPPVPVALRSAEADPPVMVGF